MRLSRVFWQYDSRGAAVLPDVLEAMQSDDVRLQICAIWLFHDVSFNFSLNYATPSDTVRVDFQIQHLERFVSLLKSDNPDLRLATLVCLSQAALPQIADAVIERLDDDDLLIQEMAAKALGYVKSQQSFDALSKVAQITHDRVRRQALNALITLGGEQVITTLHTLLNHTDQWTRETAVRGLRRLNRRESVSLLVERLHIETDQSVKSSILWTLGEIGDPIAIPELLNALKTEDDGMRLESPFDAALYALTIIHNEQALPTLYKIVNEGSSSTRRMRAVEVISRIGSEQESADRMFQLL
jgi:HEAT repeat protein